MTYNNMEGLENWVKYSTLKGWEHKRQNMEHINLCDPLGQGWMETLRALNKDRYI